MTLDLAKLEATNVERARVWHPGFPKDNDWLLVDWSNAMGGECGEAQNVVKKLRRKEFQLSGAVDPSVNILLDKLGEEIADTILYAILLAAKAGIDLEQAIVLKFNQISVREGFPHRMADDGSLWYADSIDVESADATLPPGR